MDGLEFVAVRLRVMYRFHGKHFMKRVDELLYVKGSLHMSLTLTLTFFPLSQS
eukprot:m.89517 g.89517  ORF g.89517 m.89517 type:complete len:53 (-) comp12896_c0_seq2:123-281(-)